MSKKIFRLALSVTLLTISLPADAQQQAKIPKIGELLFRPGPTLGAGREVFRRSLRELGYVEGKSIAYETRSAEGKLDRFPVLTDELLRLKVDLLAASSTAEALAFKTATRAIPIVFVVSSDPVSDGLVDSLARPGGNITGVTTIASVLAGKRLELLRETVPNLHRVAVLWNPRDPGSTQQWKESQLAGQELRLQLHSMEVSGADRYESAFKEAMKAGSGALAQMAGSVASANRKQIADLAAKHRLPAIFEREDFVVSGGLISYGPDRAESYRRAAVMVDKILKGTKPADIPVEQPTKFELVINLKAAKQIGLTIPQSVLFRADRVIK
ncbi:MAG: ABC transporter substrate-binding protein [Deltaproteobacteria bacterium]|nr:MAG: ABC transporter substrate-binding protein [Deltaproteobacteria bacterium]